MQNLILQNAIWYVFCDIIIDNKLYVIMDIFVYLTLCFTSLFTLMDPLGVMPVFLQMTDGMDTKERRYIALKACTIAFIILVLFTLSGRFLFHFFGVSGADRYIYFHILSRFLFIFILMLFFTHLRLPFRRFPYPLK
mgnify:CR=1 FL=1